MAQNHRRGRSAPRRTTAAMPPLPVGEFAIATGTAEFRTDPAQPGMVTVIVNNAASSRLRLDDPAVLDFEYMQWMAIFIDRIDPIGRPVDALHLGATGCSLAAYVESTRRDSRQLAIEIDPVLAEVVRTHLPLPRSPRLRLRVGDASVELATLHEHSRDLIIRDIFADDAVPAAVMGREFFAHCRRVLRPGGLLLANSAHRQPLSTLRTEIQDLRAVFSTVALALEPGQRAGRRFGNQLLIAADSDVILDRADEHGVAAARALRSASAPVALLTGDDLDDFLDRK